MRAASVVTVRWVSTSTVRWSFATARSIPTIAVPSAIGATTSAFAPRQIDPCTIWRVADPASACESGVFGHDHSTFIHPHNPR